MYTTAVRSLPSPEGHERRFVCHQCHFFTYNCYTLQRHMTRKHPGRVEIKCTRPDCQRCFPSWKELRKHEAVVHHGQILFTDVRWTLLEQARYSSTPTHLSTPTPEQIGMTFLEFYAKQLLIKEEEDPLVESST